MRVAVILHVGALAPLPELLRDITNIRFANIPFDLFVNLVEGKVDVTSATGLIKTAFPGAVIVTSENRGMDIGGFFKVLPLVLSGEQKYDYILKLHTKSAQWWRRKLIMPICGNPYQIRYCLQTLKANPKVGMIGTSQHLYTEIKGRRPNHHYLETLSQKFKLPLTSFHFIGGTMFWIRVSILDKALQGQDLESLRQELNTPETFDPYWYLLQYRDDNVKTVTEAQEHWDRHGQKAGRFRNCLDAREKGSQHYIPDGMLEHAYERWFGWIVKHAGQTVMGF